MILIASFQDSNPVDPNLLGGKGAGLKTMTKAGLPVPPGFTVTTTAWREYSMSQILSDKLISEIWHHMSELENLTGKKFGDSKNPLLVSVRSGAKFSMPGMMDTILNVGMTKSAIQSFPGNTGEELYIRFLKMYACSNYEMTEDSFNNVKKDIASYEEFIAKTSRLPISDDPKIHLLNSIKAVFDSWFSPGATSYRELKGIPNDMGTAVNIQAMVLGNLPDSGTGVLFTRNTITGVNEMTGEYLKQAQGEEVVSGTSERTPMPISSFYNTYPQIADQLFAHARTLERVHTDVQDIEFTIEQGKVWLLQTRNAVKSPLASIKIASDLAKEGIISYSEALRRIKPGDIRSITSPSFDKISEDFAQKDNLVAQGMASSPGVAVGSLCITIDEVHKSFKENKDLILLVDHLDPNDVETLSKVKGVITRKGSPSSHMGLIFRSMKIPAVMGCHNLPALKSGQTVSINGSTGYIYSVSLKLAQPNEIPADLIPILSDRQRIYKDSVWSAGAYLSNPEFDLEKKVLDLTSKWEKVKETWRSDKSRSTEIFNYIFPRNIIIPSVVVPKNDVQKIKSALEQVTIDGYFNSPRTCHHPVKLAGAPWAFGPDTPEQLTDFLSNPNYPGKYGGYPKWLEDSTLESIMIPWEERGKLDPGLAESHFAATLTCIDTSPAQLILTINFATPQLRSLEKVESSNLVMVKIKILDTAEYGIGDMSLEIGTGIEAKNCDRYKTLTQKIAKQIFETWWRPPTYLPYLMLCMDQVVGMSVLEIQGRFEEENLKWVKIYGTKGAEEKEKATLSVKINP